MPILVHAEIFLDGRVDLHKQSSEGPAGALINLLISQQSPEVLRVNKQKILIGWIIYVEYLDNGREPLGELVPTDGTRRVHRHHDLYLIIKLDEL